MKKNILYSLIALLGLFTACKTGTDPKPIDPIVPVTPSVPTMNPYKNSRLLAITDDDGSISRLFYNTQNQVTKIEYFKNDSTGISKLNSSQNFTYNIGNAIQVAYANEKSLNSVIYDYKYQGNQIESYSISTVTNVDPTKQVVTVKYNYIATYLNGNLSKLLFQNAKKDSLYQQNNYTYSLLNNNPVRTIEYVPQSLNAVPALPKFTSTSEYYKDIIDPESYFIPSEDPNSFLIKNYVLSSNLNFGYAQTYELDALGRVKTLTTTYPNSPKFSGKVTYSYETY